jgi:photosystem II stability/assembly factor-like uncharacterized protein
MRSVRYPRTVVAALVVTGALLASSLVAVSGASRRAATAVAKPPRTVTATLITRRSGTLAPGTAAGSANVVGQRVFTDAKHGFALASVGGADYPVATTDGGQTWKTDGPALHLDAAQAPLAVVFIGAVNRKTAFAWGGGQVIDATSDGGKHWYSALFGNGGPVAVVHTFAGHLLAFIGSSSGSTTWQYVSKDGGRTWHYQATVAR